MKQILHLLLICLPIFAEAQITEYHLTNTDLFTSDNFGTSVTVSNKYVAVGSTGLDNNTGGVLMYLGSGENWNHQSTLIASDAKEGDYFGMDVSMTNDLLVVGSPTDHWSDDETGKAYIYELQDNQWVESSILQPDDSYYQSAFGFIVNIHEEQVMIGAPDYDISNGALAIYEKDGTDWKLAHEFINSDYQLNSFGCAFDMNENWLAIGGYHTDFDSIELGNRFTIQMYERQGNNWEERQVINYARQSLPYQIPAYNIELSEDQLLIGNHRPTPEENIDGESKVFHLINNQWQEVQNLLPNGIMKNEMGRQLALGERYAIINSSNEPSSSIEDPHHILIYNTENKNNWTLVADFRYEESSSLNWQGFNVDINDFYGVASSHNHANEHGDVYIYDIRRFVDNQNIINDRLVNVYPIPADNILNIELEDHNLKSYIILNSMGQIMLKANVGHSQSEQLNISQLAAGTYWLKVETDAGHLYRKITKI